MLSESESNLFGSIKLRDMGVGSGNGRLPTDDPPRFGFKDDYTIEMEYRLLNTLVSLFGWRNLFISEALQVFISSILEFNQRSLK